jgi:uncharacterized membrane protein
LSDGVFAITMTLLVLEIKVPALEGAAAAKELPHQLLALWPKFAAYAISFVTLGVYWVGHHLQFASIHRADRNLLWINILFLLCTGFVPFTTALMGEYWTEPLPVVLYGLNLVAVSLMIWVHWTYASRGRRLIAPEIDDGIIVSASRVILLGPVVYAIAIALAWVHTGISIALYGLANLLYIVPRGVHRHLKAGDGAAGAPGG